MENTTILILVVIIVLASLLPEILEVVGHVAEALGLGQVDEDPCGALATPVPADTAVAEAPAGRALPDRVHQGLPGALPVPDSGINILMKMHKKNGV